MENNVPYAVSLPNAKPSNSLKAAFDAAAIGIPEPNAEVCFREGCIRMGFYYRQNFKIALKRQQDLDALGKSIAGARLPEPHWKSDGWWFYLNEVEAYTADAHDE